MTHHIGTSGWSYDHWEGVLYPPKLPKGQRLEVYIQHYGTVELNASFYHWPGRKSFESWQRRLPSGFLMSVKAPRNLTHGKRLRDPERSLATISAGLELLGEKLGVLLVQLPPDFERDEPRLDEFLAQTPAGLKVAVEFRHPSWHVEPVFELLQRRGAAYTVMSGAGLPCILRATAPFVYVRLHGPSPSQMYGGSYSEDDLRWWAQRIREWEAGGREVFAYFNNDGGGNAVRNADRLKELL